MVSWWHSFNIRWKSLLKGYGSVAVEAMRSAQINFGLLDLKDKAFERDLIDWFAVMDAKKIPGLFLVATKGNEGEEKGVISVLHHVIVMDESSVPDIVGLESTEATMVFKGVRSIDLFGKLTPHKGARKAGASDYFVPSVDGLVEGTHPKTGRFVPGAKDVCDTIQSLESKINGVFVPYPLAQLLLGEEVDIEESEDEGEELRPEPFDSRNPMDLLGRLVRVMTYKKNHQPEWYRDWKAIVQEVVGLLWSVGNGFAPGIEVIPTAMNRRLIEHQMSCSLELFKSHQEQYSGVMEDYDSEEVKVDEEAGLVQTRPGDEEKESQTATSEARPSTVGEEIEVGERFRGSPFSKSSASPSPRREQPSISFNIGRIGRQTEASEGETKQGDTEGSGRGEGRPGEGLGQEGPRNIPEGGFPAGVPDWVENIAGRFLSGLLETTKALSTAGVSLSEFADASKASLNKTEEKKKATSKWLPSGVFLFKVLSAEDGWETKGVPEFTDFAMKLIDQKIFGATQLIRAQKKAMKWSGGLLKPGVGEFLKRGFVSEDVQVGPSGFSVLFFHPSCYADTDSEEFSVQQLNESFGDGKLPEEMMKTFSKLQIWIPQTVQDAEEQIDTAIKFLKSICGEATIATGGYETGLKQLAENRRLFRARGTMFLVNYMYMLDRVFQAFCQEMLKYEQEEDPIQVARVTGARGWMDKLVEGPFNSWLVAGTVPLYSPPSAWDDRKFGEGLVDLHSGKGRGSGGGGGGSGTPASPAAKKRKVEKSGDDGKEKAWHRALDQDEYVKEWFVPEGEEFFNYFSPSKPENFYGFPRVTHHKTGRPANICVRYVVGNGPGCSRGLSCLRSHIKMNDLSAEEKERITKQFKKVYSSGGKSS